MTALLLANLYKDSSNMQHAVEQAIASLQAVLQASAEVSGPAAHSRERSAEVGFFLVNVLWFVFSNFCSHGSENVSLNVVHQTHACAAQQQHVITALHDLQVCKARELRLIQNQHLILSPPVKLKVQPLDTHAD